MLSSLATREAAIRQDLINKALSKGNNQQNLASKDQPVATLTTPTHTEIYQHTPKARNPEQSAKDILREDMHWKISAEYNPVIQQAKHAQISTETNDNISNDNFFEKNIKTSSAGIKTAWSDEDQVLVDWIINLQQENLPVEPFDLYQGVRVISSARFLASLKQQVESGPSSARARSGVLQGDLRQLMEIVKNKQTEIITNVR